MISLGILLPSEASGLLQPVVLQTFFASFLFDAPQMQSIVKVSGQHISGTEKKTSLLLSTRGVAFSHWQIQITAVTYRKFAGFFLDISKKTQANF